MRIALILTLLLSASGCFQTTIFEKRLPEPIRKEKRHIENERQGALMLAKQTKSELANTLSYSLGYPQNLDSSETITANLKADIAKHQNKQDSLNEELARYEGKTIAGTGFNIGKVMNWGLLVGIIVLVVMFPPIITILGFLLKRANGCLRAITMSIDNYSSDSPTNANELKRELAKNMDSTHKQIIGKLQNG
jgi:hypothetical protein